MIARHRAGRIAAIEPQDSVEALQAAGVHVIHGDATFTDPTGRRRPPGSTTSEQLRRLLDEAPVPDPAPVTTHWAMRPGAPHRTR